MLVVNKYEIILFLVENPRLLFSGTIDDFIFANTGLSDGGNGAILLVMSLIILCVCLVIMVKTLHSMMKGSIARAIKKVINTDFKSPFGWVVGKCVGSFFLFLLQVVDIDLAQGFPT